MLENNLKNEQIEYKNQILILKQNHEKLILYCQSRMDKKKKESKKI